MSEITPYDDEELNEHGLRLRCRDLRAYNARLAARVKVLEEALVQSNRYIDEAVKKRMLRYDEAVAKHGTRSPEAREQSKLLHDLINGTRNSFDSVHRVLAALVTDGGGE